ncbi:heterodisulfide reductase-related iron-sulfur binding cluster [Desulfosarcina ovata]|uniref:Cysteine-rich domain-containing protein n=1 Tax=Desulfosarcina ovata subsp. ovata TaxID=2752305 RepID=A0A5K8A8P9_9BACT|nr:(Fe-S)-binding protein [Desulfosarcina ovata]BBO88808.1 hypothetical protein DSCOOX_19880 [Desulfosarcina ovata subsp. ovata]
MMQLTDMLSQHGARINVRHPYVTWITGPAPFLESKLADVAATNADLLVTECPGCVMQLRGGAEKKGMKLSVKHIAEAMVQALEKT